MNLQEALTEFNVIRDTYKSLDYTERHKTAMLMKNMAICQSYLTSQRIEAKEKWTSIVFMESKDKSNAAAEKIADQKVPELYQLRLIQKDAQTLIDTMRSQISLLKQEQ